MTRRLTIPLRSGGPRRKTLWGGSTVPQANETGLPAATSQLFARFTAATIGLVFGVPCTVVRNRGLLSIRSDQTAQSENAHGAIGLAVVTETAAAAGIASIPSPITESDWDGWLMWQPWSTAFTLTGTGASGAPVSYGYFPYDSRAMRKIEDEESLVFVIENQDAGGGVVFTWLSRTLFKLH